MDQSSSEITRVLQNMDAGSCDARQLMPLVYDELRRMAAGRMSRENPGHTLQPTALVHEAWLRLGGENQTWQNRAHFFGAAAEAMRRILIESARRRSAARRGGNQERVEIEKLDLELHHADRDDEILAVHESLDRLAAHDARKAELVKLHYFIGLTFEEAAEILNISEPTAKRDWAYARAWLARDIEGNRG